VIGNEINGSAAELRPVVMVCTVAIFFYCGVVVALGGVDVSAEGTDPLVPILDPTHERIDVCSAFLAANNGVIFKRDGRHLLTLEK